MKKGERKVRRQSFGYLLIRELEGLE